SNLKALLTLFFSVSTFVASLVCFRPAASSKFLLHDQIPHHNVVSNPAVFVTKHGILTAFLEGIGKLGDVPGYRHDVYIGLGYKKPMYYVRTCNLKMHLSSFRYL